MTNKYLLSLNTGASYELGGETPDANPIFELEIETDSILDASTGLAI
jgi:hypothetical protein